jgi:hypothetical protein
MSKPESALPRSTTFRWLAPALVALVGLGACGGEIAVTPSECDTLRGLECTPRKRCISVATTKGTEVCGRYCSDGDVCLDGRKPVVGTHYRHPDEAEDYLAATDVCVCVP